NQAVGSLIQGASRALTEEVTFNKRQVTGLDWVSYPILRFKDTPEITFEYIQRTDIPAASTGVVQPNGTTAPASTVAASGVQVGARAPADENRVPLVEQAGAGGSRGRAAFDCAGDRGEAGARVPERQADPPREVALVGRCVPDQVTACELAQGCLALDPRRPSDPVPRQHVCVPAIEERPAERDAAQARQHQQVHERLSGRRHVRGIDAEAQLVAREGTVL